MISRMFVCEIVSSNRNCSHTLKFPYHPVKKKTPILVKQAEVNLEKNSFLKLVIIILEQRISICNKECDWIIET